MKQIGFTPFIVVLSFCVLGMFFKIQHWPFAGVLIVLSFPTLAMLSIVLALTNKPDEGRSPKFSLLLRGTLLAFSCYAIGACFQIQRWPMGTMLAIIGGASCLFFGLMLYMSGTKNEGDKLNSNAVLIGLIAFFVVSLAFGLSMRRKQDMKELTSEWHSIMPESRDCFAAGKMALEMKAAIVDSVGIDTIQTQTKEHQIKELQWELVGLLRGLHNTLISYHGYTLEESDTLNIDVLGNQLYITDFSNHYLIGQDPLQPTGEGKNLKEKLFQLEIAISNKDLAVAKYGDQDKDGVKMSWEASEFWDVPLAQVLTKLKRLELRLCQKSL